MGTGYYFTFGVLFPFIFAPVILHTILKQQPLQRKRLIIRLTVMFLAAFLFIIPSFSSFSGYWGELDRHSFRKPFYTSRVQVAINGANTFLLFFDNHDRYNNHYLYGGYFDGISQLFIVIGLLGMLYTLLNKSTNPTKTGLLRIIITYISTVLVLTAVNPYEYISILRGCILIPFGSMFAGYGLYKLLIIKRISLKLSLPIVFIILLAPNIYKANVYVYQNTGTHKYSHILRIMENKEPLVVVVSDTDLSDYLQVLDLLKSAYGLDTNIKFVNQRDYDCHKYIKWKKAVFFNQVQYGTVERLVECGVTEYEVIDHYIDLQKRATFIESLLF